MRKYKTIKKILLIITLLAISLIALFPILYPLMSSFRSDQEMFAYANPFQWHTLIPVDWTIDSYVQLFRDYHMGRYFLNSLIEVSIVIPVTIILCSLAAFAFAYYEFPAKKIFFGLFMVSFMIPGEAISLPLYQLVNQMGLVNTYAGLILPALANGLALFMLTQSFKDIPKSLLEAVRMDGGNWFTCYWKIVMPLSKPAILSMSLMIFVNEWNNYLWPLLVARADSVKTVTIAISNFKQENIINWSLIYAGSMVSAILPILIFLPFQKYFAEGIANSGIKE